MSAGRVTTNEVENATRIDKITDEEMKSGKKWSFNLMYKKINKKRSSLK